MNISQQEVIQRLSGRNSRPLKPEAGKVSNLIVVSPIRVLAPARLGKENLIVSPVHVISSGQLVKRISIVVTRVHDISSGQIVEGKSDHKSNLYR